MDGILTSYVVLKAMMMEIDPMWSFLELMTRSLASIIRKVNRKGVEISCVMERQFRVVDVLMTNFHFPETTLLMLVSAFAGVKTVRDAYAHAVQERYRFYSYGDAMLIQ